MAPTGRVAGSGGGVNGAVRGLPDGWHEVADVAGAAATGDREARFIRAVMNAGLPTCAAQACWDGSGSHPALPHPCGSSQTECTTHPPQRLPYPTTPTCHRAPRPGRMPTTPGGRSSARGCRCPRRHRLSSRWSGSCTCGAGARRAPRPAGGIPPRWRSQERGSQSQTYRSTGSKSSTGCWQTQWCVAWVDGAGGGGGMEVVGAVVGRGQRGKSGVLLGFDAPACEYGVGFEADRLRQRLVGHGRAGVCDSYLLYLPRLAVRCCAAG